jgi:hypothetical protein
MGMVSKVKVCGLDDYVCEECGFVYHDRETAELCENYCRTHHACSLEITSKAVHKPMPRI